MNDSQPHVFMIPGRRMLPAGLILIAAASAAWGARQLWMGESAWGGFLILCAAILALQAVPLLRPTRTVVDDQARACTISRPRSGSRTLAFEQIESVNLLLGPGGAGRRAWICLAVKHSPQFVAVAETSRRAANKSPRREEALHEQAQQLAALVGCPLHTIANAHPAMNRASLEESQP